MEGTYTRGAKWSLKKEKESKMKMKRKTGQVGRTAFQSSSKGGEKKERVP